MWQKRPAYVAKETCVCGKRDLPLQYKANLSTTSKREYSRIALLSDYYTHRP